MDAIDRLTAVVCAESPQLCARPNLSDGPTMLGLMLGACLLVWWLAW